MCNVKKWFGPSAAEKETQQRALKAQEEAAAAAKAAMVPVQDSQAARDGADARMRRSLSLHGAAAAFSGGAMPASAYGVKSLLGS